MSLLEANALKDGCDYLCEQVSDWRILCRCYDLLSLRVNMRKVDQNHSNRAPFMCIVHTVRIGMDQWTRYYLNEEVAPVASQAKQRESFESCLRRIEKLDSSGLDTFIDRQLIGQDRTSFFTVPLTTESHLAKC